MKHTNFDFQFVVILENEKGESLDCQWSGVEYGNSWAEACAYAKQWVAKCAAKGEILQARVNDRMKRKQDLIVTP